MNSLEAAPTTQQLHQMNPAVESRFRAIGQAIQSITFSSVLLGAVLGMSAAQSSAQPLSEQVKANLTQQADMTSQSCLDQVYQHAADAIQVCQQAVSLNQAIGNRRIAAYSLGNLGTLYLQQQDYRQAVALYQQALNAAEKINDQPLKIKALIALGTGYSRLQQPQRALSYYQTALTVAEAIHDQTGMSVAYYNLGLMYDTLGQYQLAVDAYNNAATIAVAANDPLLSGYAFGKLKLANQALGQASNQTSNQIVDQVSN